MVRTTLRNGDNITYNLAAKGYNVAKILPFGPIKNLMPYLIRRAEENSSFEDKRPENKFD